MTTRISLISNDAVNSGNISNGTVNSEDLNKTAGQQAVTTDVIRDGAVTSTKLQNDASTDANRAVGTNHIKEGAVTSTKLAAGAVTSTKLAEGAVTSTNLAEGAVTSTKLAAGAVTSTKLADDAVTLDKLAAETEAYLVPVGAIFHFASSTAPTGYLVANGNTVPNGVGTVQGIKANFSALYEILGSTYGAAGKLPDLRGEFIRGWDANRGIDASTGGGMGPILSRVFGSSQDDAFRGHTHDLGYSSGGTAEIGSGIIRGIQTLLATTKGYTGAMSTEGGTETRPRNVALLPCIKY